MKLMLLLAVVFFVLLNIGLYAKTSKTKAIPQSIYDISVQTIDGKTQSLSTYKGKTILIVNVASKCGFTSQYADLESLYKKYEKKGLVILGFPSNEFGWQEPGTNDEISAFCKLEYGVTFPMFAKLKTNGKEAHPLYQFLTNKERHPQFSGRILWNFNKFLVDPKGNVIGRYGSTTKPQDSEIVSAIEKTFQ